LCRIDLYFLLRYALKREDVQREWIFQRCREVQEGPNGYIDIWSREHYKSTIITFGKNIQDILASHGDEPLDEWKGREVTIGIFSFNRPAAKKFLNQIKTEFEDNAELKVLFPDILYQNPRKESPKWSEDGGIVVKRKSNPREATVEASGLVDGQPTGMHYVIRSYDDVVTLESARSVEMIKKTTQAWGLSLSLGSEGGHARYAGTFYADGDTYSEIIERGGAKPRIHPATADGLSSGEPVLFSQEYLDDKKFSGIYDFSCQYLCNPIPDDNAYFSIDDFRWYDQAPTHLRKYGASDYAVSEGKGDYTELGIAGVDSNDDLYLLDWWSGQTTADVWIDHQLDLVKRHKPIMWASESGVIRKSIEPFLAKRMMERREYITLDWLPTVADKPTMCRSFQARAKMGKVYLPSGVAWAEDLVSQLVRFPKAKYDDKVDVCGLFGRILDNMHGAVVPSAPHLKLVSDSYGFEEDLENNWMTS
jgi:predicted phage terminase large subunit-like protein